MPKIRHYLVELKDCLRPRPGYSLTQRSNGFIDLLSDLITDERKELGQSGTMMVLTARSLVRFDHCGHQSPGLM